MATINLYKGLGEEYKTIKANGKIGDILKDFDPNINLDHCIFLNGGRSVSRDYIAHEGEIIFVREAPNGVTTVCLVISAVVAAVALGVGIYGAVQSQKAKEQLADAEKKSRDLSSKTETLPFLKGAKNSSAIGNNIPFIMGSIHHTPYLLTSGFYSIGGTNGQTQYWNAILVVGYKDAIINNLSVGSQLLVGYNVYEDVPKLDGSFERVFYMSRNNTHPYQFHSGPYTADGNKIELRDTGEIELNDAYNTKISTADYGDEIPHKYSDTTDWKDGLQKQLESNTYRADVCIVFNGLRKYSDGWKSKNVKFSIYWANDISSGTPTWHLATSGIETGEINSDKTVRFETSIIFSAAECYGKDISLKIVRETPCEESNGQETAYLCYINCWQYDYVKSSSTNIVPCSPIEQPWRDRTLRIGISLVANDSTKDTLDEINCMAYGRARIWDGTEWTSEKYPTRNPASWVLEVMTSDCHTHSKYLDSEIDLEALGALFEYCDKQKFYCDGIVTSDIKKSDLLNGILLECNATMYLDNEGKWTFAIEQAQNLPVALLNEQSIKKITVTKSFERKAFAQKISFVDRTTWATNTAYIDEENNVGSIAIYDKNKLITETAVSYITDGNHAYKYARRLMARQRLQPREITVQVGHEGDYYPMYSKVLLQMKQLAIGLSNGVIHAVKIENNLITQIETSDFCEFESGKRFGIIIQAQNDSDRQHIYLEVESTSGKTKLLTVTNPVTVGIIPEYGNIYSFGYLNDDGSFKSITNEMMIYSTKQNKDGWELTLKDYNEALFEYGAIPEYKTNLTAKKALTTSEAKVTLGDLQSYASATVGADGYSSMTITLYQRSFNKPALPTDTITYYFEEKALSPSSALNSWSVSIPEIDENNLPCWEIHATALSKDVSDEIEVSEWSEPAKILSNSNISLADVAELIQKLEPSPIVQADISAIGFAVDRSDRAMADQQKTVTFDVVQNVTHLDFKFGEIIYPNGWTVTTDEKKVTIAIPKGTKLTTEYITIPVIYRPFAQNYWYAYDSNGSKIYVTDDINILGDFKTVSEIPSTAKEKDVFNFVGTETVDSSSSTGVFKTNVAYQLNSLGKWEEFNPQEYAYGDIVYGEETTKNMVITCEQVKGGAYLNGISSTSNIPANAVLGDFFCWTGENTDSSLCAEGTFKQTAVYVWNGIKWAKTNDYDLNSTAMTDVLSVGASVLKENNSVISEKFDRIVSNTAIIEKLIASSVFTDALNAMHITLGYDETKKQGGIIKSSNFVKGSKGWQIDYEGNAEFSSVTMHGTVNNSDVKKGTIEEADIKKLTTGSSSSDTTVAISGGGWIDSESTQGFGILRNGNAYFNNGTFRGKIEATSGSFNGDITGGTININDKFRIAEDGTATLNGLFKSSYGIKLNDFSVGLSESNITNLEELILNTLAYKDYDAEAVNIATGNLEFTAPIPYDTENSFTLYVYPTQIAMYLFSSKPAIDIEAHNGYITMAGQYLYQISDFFMRLKPRAQYKEVDIYYSAAYYTSSNISRVSANITGTPDRTDLHLQGKIYH